MNISQQTLQSLDYIRTKYRQIIEMLHFALIMKRKMYWSEGGKQQQH